MRMRLRVRLWLVFGLLFVLACGAVHDEAVMDGVGHGAGEMRAAAAVLTPATEASKAIEAWGGVGEQARARLSSIRSRQAAGGARFSFAHTEGATEAKHTALGLAARIDQGSAEYLIELLLLQVDGCFVGGVGAGNV